MRAVVLRRDGLRWPFPAALGEQLSGQTIGLTGRRGKYLLIHFQHGTLIIHLGMSGHLRVLPPGTEALKHDHFDLVVEGDDGEQVLRLTDPRRFGSVLWQAAGSEHPLLRGLGPEPLSDAFDGHWLFERSRSRSAPVKTFLMDQRIVVGVGNIYAAESLFRAGIHPLRAAGKVSRERYVALADAARTILAQAIERGGTTLRDFLNPDGAPGYFEQELAVYGRGGLPCPACGRPLRQVSIGQRASVWCPRCQR